MDSSRQCTVTCSVSRLCHLTEWPPQAESVDTCSHYQALSSLAPSDNLRATANKLSYLPWGHSSCFLTNCWCHPASRRPFPAGDRVTFNGKDCLCQYCVEPMSPGPKDILGSSSKYPETQRQGGHLFSCDAILAISQNWEVCNRV